MIKHKGPSIVASSLFFAFIFYLGSKIASGDKMDGNRGIMSFAAEGLNFLADTFGHQIAGYGIMGIALFSGVFCAIWLWRSPWF